MITKQTKFVLAIALQVAIIFTVIILKLSILNNGVEVLLQIAPVDPRDLLRGDYVTFQYNISRLDSYYSQKQKIENGDTVYVVLRQNGKYWVMKSIQKTKPAGDDLFIKGKVEGDGRIIYGIEQYFIPEGKGQNFNFRNSRAAAMVVIDDGNAVLKKIYIDDKPWP